MQITSSAQFGNCRKEDRSDAYFLVQGPPWGDAEFLGKWLLAAAQAERYWKEAFEDAAFHEQVRSVCCYYIPDFGIAAAVMVMQLKEFRTTFLLDANTEDGMDFVMMVTMGLFVPIAQGYQMVLPEDLTAEKVRAAVLKYAKTEDAFFVLHPEHIVTTMPLAEARAWQDRLRAIDDFNSESEPSGRA